MLSSASGSVDVAGAGVELPLAAAAAGAPKEKAGGLAELEVPPAVGPPKLNAGAALLLAPPVDSAGLAKVNADAAGAPKEYAGLGVSPAAALAD